MKRAAEVMENVISDLGTAVYERSREGSLQLLGRAPAWMGELASADLREDAARAPDEVSPFLENFLVDAEAFWAEQRPGTLDSGPWCEGGIAGGEWNLEATAVCLSDGSQALVVKLLQETYTKFQDLLQGARSASLEHERMRREVQKKEVLLHCIVHDLKGPLAGIVGGLSLLKRPTLAPDKAREMIELGLSMARKQESMIRLILDVFSKEIESMEAFETEPEMAPDVIECVHAARALMQPAYQTKGVHLLLELPERASIKVVGSADRLERILANLLENALRYGPVDSTVSLGVRLEGERAVVWVSDQGPGVKPELRESLFEKFSRDRHSGGVSGLGLYFCRYTVEEWGGTIGYGPGAEGRGSRFFFELPLALGK